ncbi:MAG: PH domain-containing protein, partial [Patescibacteria group bacterium]
VQDITSEMKGIFGTFFNFGDVYIQTAGEKERFIFRQIPNPNEVVRKISNLAELKRKYEKVKEELEEG